MTSKKTIPLEITYILSSVNSRFYLRKNRMVKFLRLILIQLIHLPHLCSIKSQVTLKLLKQEQFQPKLIKMLPMSFN